MLILVSCFSVIGVSFHLCKYCQISIILQFLKYLYQPFNLLNGYILDFIYYDLWRFTYLDHFGRLINYEKGYVISSISGNIWLSIENWVYKMSWIVLKFSLCFCCRITSNGSRKLDWNIPYGFLSFFHSFLLYFILLLFCLFFFWVFFVYYFLWKISFLKDRESLLSACLWQLRWRVIT